MTPNVNCSSPGTAAANRRGVPAGSDLQRQAEQVLDCGGRDHQLAGGDEGECALAGERGREL